MKSDSPVVSIVVPCRNEKDHIETVLNTILSQDPPIGGFEVIVADGMSDDGTREILLRKALEDSRIRMVDNKDRIVSTGLNAAIRDARGDIIIRMDAHTEYAADYVRQCVEVLRETAADTVGGPWIARGKGKIGTAIAAAFQSPFSCGGARGHKPNYSGPVDTVYLGCWSRDIFDRLGLFDEELVRNQDDEFNLRTIRSGGTIWQSTKIKSCYRPREDVRRLFMQYLQYGYWKVRVIQKHRLPASLRHLIPVLFVSMVMLLPVLTMYWPPALLIWIGLVGLYLTINVFVSLLISVGKGWNLFPLLPLIFVAFHFGYGLGFARGLADFVVLRRKPSRRFTYLTRRSDEEAVG